MIPVRSERFFSAFAGPPVRLSSISDREFESSGSFSYLCFNFSRFGTEACKTMKIVLIGEYSNVHWTLAEGLRALGHEVTVVSDGDGWKNYPRDLSLTRHSLSLPGTLRYLFDVARHFPRLRGYDVVQLINPIFLDLTAERIYPFYRYLRKHNKRVFMGAFGIDHYWVKTGLDCTTFRYSDFNLGRTLRQNPDNDVYIRDWLRGEKGKLNRYIAADCDGIVTGLYEYDACYRPHYPDKTEFIPFPINRAKITPIQPHPDYAGIRFFIGIQKQRNAYKGTDIMLRALERLQRKYPQRMEIVKAESVPFARYQNMMNTSDVLLDQLYSYTPAMNALLAMAKGLVVVGGGEEENYEILNEQELRPIVNVQPDEEDVFEQLEQRILLHPEQLPALSAQSVAYIARHHDHIRVARRYLDFWNRRQ